MDAILRLGVPVALLGFAAGCGAGTGADAMSPSVSPGAAVSVQQTARAASPDAPAPAPAPADADADAPAPAPAPAPVAAPSPTATTTVTREALLKAMNPGLQSGVVHIYDDYGPEQTRGHTWDIWTSSGESTLTHLLVQAYNPLDIRPLLTRVSLNWHRTATGGIEFADTSEFVMDGGAHVESMSIDKTSTPIEAETFELPAGTDVYSVGKKLVSYTSEQLPYEYYFRYTAALVLSSGDGTPGSFRLCVRLDHFGRVVRDGNARISCSLHDADGNMLGVEGQFVPYSVPYYYAGTRILKQVKD